MDSAAIKTMAISTGPARDRWVNEAAIDKIAEESYLVWRNSSL